MDKEKLEKLRENRRRSLLILDEIEKGNTSLTDIAVKTQSTTQLVHWYLKTLNVKGITSVR
ncbi:MAG: hypothetical protein U1C12_00985 [Patescibacteria group bacterium]|nr:hypothetical protein [Patescibacteria group bacterium]